MLAEPGPGVEQEPVHRLCGLVRGPGLQGVAEIAAAEQAERPLDQLAFGEASLLPGAGQFARPRVARRGQLQSPGRRHGLGLRPGPGPGFAPVADPPGHRPPGLQAVVAVQPGAAQVRPHGQIQGEQPVALVRLQGEGVAHRGPAAGQGQAAPVAFTPPPAFPVEFPEDDTPPVALLGRRHGTVELHPEGHLVVHGQAGDGAEADLLGKPGFRLDERGPAPQPALDPREQQEEHQREWQGLEGKVPGQAQGRPQAERGLLHVGEYRGVAEHGQDDIGGRGQRVAEEHAADNDEIAEDDGNGRVAAVAQLEQLERDHQAEQADKGLHGQAVVGEHRHQEEERAGHGLERETGHGQRPAQGKSVIGPHGHAEQGRDHRDVRQVEQGGGDHRGQDGPGVGFFQVRGQDAHQCRARARRQRSRWPGPRFGPMVVAPRRRP